MSELREAAALLCVGAVVLSASILCLMGVEKFVDWVMKDR